MNIGRRGFTLIEILIVVAIIAILASVVLVGLGPTQQAGRDARRLSDLREVQNGLELFYQDCGFYPGGTATVGTCAKVTAAPTDWTTMGTIISGIVPNIGTIPNDPSTNRTYSYGYWNVAPIGSGYLLGAILENTNNAVFNGYTAPATIASYTIVANAGATAVTTCTAAAGEYCITL